jgi:hypothetical protein
MAEVNRYEFNYAEVALALVKQQDIHEGIWAVAIKFGIGATLGGPSEAEAVPTAMVPVLSIGLTKVDKEGRNTVNAAKVNPATKVSLKGTARVSASVSGKLHAK